MKSISTAIPGCLSSALSPEFSFDNVAGILDVADCIMEAVAALPPVQKSALALYRESLPLEEIAQRLETSVVMLNEQIAAASAYIFKHLQVSGINMASTIIDGDDLLPYPPVVES